MPSSVLPHTEPGTVEEARSRQTATLLGGEVEVLDHPDEGAIFVFSLPVLEAGA